MVHSDGDSDGVFTDHTQQQRSAALWSTGLGLLVRRRCVVIRVHLAMKHLGIDEMNTRSTCVIVGHPVPHLLALLVDAFDASQAAMAAGVMVCCTLHPDDPFLFILVYAISGDGPGHNRSPVILSA